jgi:acyl carrier protein
MDDLLDHAAMLSRLGTYICSEILKQPQRQIEARAPLITSGLIDSFHLVDLALYVEDTFGVHIDDTELRAETFDTLDQLAALIETRRGK